MNLKGQNIQVNEINLHVVVEGTGPDVIMLHGFPDTSRVWRNQIPALVQAGYRVTVPDLRGCGDTDAPVGKNNYVIDTLMKDVTCMMDHLGIKNARFIGHDWGAILGWFVAIEHPERVERYVAMSVGHPTSYKKGGIEQKLRSWYAVAFQFPYITEVMTQSFNWKLMRVLTKNHPEVRYWIEDKSRPGRLTAGLNWYRANIVRMLFGSPGNAMVPVLGIWSSGDKFLSERQMKQSNLYVKAPWRYERIENSSHWIQLDVPEQLNTLLIEYLAQPSWPGTGGGKNTGA
ncbi:MAG: alpha/beta hydrolase [Desulfomonilia bacterium]|nr:alpha/beta hydrolase [Desulfomonilia bacterium]